MYARCGSLADMVEDRDGERPAKIMQTGQSLTLILLLRRSQSTSIRFIYFAARNSSQGGAGVSLTFLIQCSRSRGLLCIIQ